MAGKSRPRNDLLCVEWDVQLYTLAPIQCMSARNIILAIINAGAVDKTDLVLGPALDTLICSLPVLPNVSLVC